MEEKDGEWLHKLAPRNSCVRILQFHGSNLSKISVQDLEMIAIKCQKSLVSLKVSRDFDLISLGSCLRSGIRLEEFYGGVVNSDPDNINKYVEFPEAFPPKLSRIGGLDKLPYEEIWILTGIGGKLTQLDVLIRWN